MIIKVCGMREASNIREVEALGVDLMGFIFWPKSSRYVKEHPDYLPLKCRRVGVFVDENVEKVMQIAEDYKLDYIQLHGHESPEYCGLLKRFHIIKAFNISTADDIAETTAYQGIVDYLLFDAKGKSAGGNGKKFDWDVLASYEGSTPFLLSGGIGPEDVDNIMACHHPQCVGIDLNSRFELSPAKKDIHLLRTFIQKIKQ